MSPLKKACNLIFRTSGICNTSSTRFLFCVSSWELSGGSIPTCAMALARNSSAMQCRKHSCNPRCRCIKLKEMHPEVTERKSFSACPMALWQSCAQQPMSSSLKWSGCSHLFYCLQCCSVLFNYVVLFCAVCDLHHRFAFPLQEPRSAFERETL